MDIDGTHYNPGEVDFRPSKISGFVEAYHKVGGTKTLIGVIAVSTAIVAVRRIGRRRRGG